MCSILIVPIHLDALYIATDLATLPPTTDFTKLPYKDPISNRDINGSSPYLGESIVSDLLQAPDFWLKAGVHLHWALPDAVTQGQSKDAGITFPTVPNRWLITRSIRIDEERVVDKRWVIDSDYLSTEPRGNVAVPYTSEANNKDKPFRFMGRKVPYEIWEERFAANPLGPLTAVGYHGEPAFAAYYANCHSVFGFYDESLRIEPAYATQYDVIGWYHAVKDDEFYKFIDSLTLTEDQTWLDAVQEWFKWTADNGSPPPKHMICYARLQFPEETGSVITRSSQAVPESDTGVYVGNTATEALAAHLAQEIDAENVSDLEERLEALQFADRLESLQIDVGLKFQEVRHTDTFSAQHAGTLWSIRPLNNTEIDSDVLDTHNRNKISLPLELAEKLNQLNKLQAHYDRSLRKIKHGQHITFTDWYKYMVSVYQTEATIDNYPDADEVMHFIKMKDIQPLNALIRDTGLLGLQVNPEGGVTGAVTVTRTGDPVAFHLANKINDLVNSLNNLNQTEAVKAAKTSFVLRQIAGPRFWGPNEPVVLLTGKAARPNDRNGHDGKLHPDGLVECQLLNQSAPENITAAFLVNHLDAIAGQFPTPETNDDSIAVNLWDGNPWHPFMLAWEVEYFPLKHQNNLDPKNREYRPDFISSNYTLPASAVELKPKQADIYSKAASTYSGSSLLTPAAGRQLTTRLRVYLDKHWNLFLTEYGDATQLVVEDQTHQWFTDNLETVLEWYQSQGTNQTLMWTATAFLHLENNEVNNLAQVLSGFNQALLMHHQTRQLPVDDPLGFDHYRAFSADLVRTAVDKQNIVAPQPFNDFNPIRAGGLKLLKLRVIDTFGAYLDVELDQLPVHTTTQLTLPNHPSWIKLLPRLVQPARINFRLLASVSDSNSGSEEMNDHPATTPICGWLVPNNLDESIMVYDRYGRALGSLTAVPDPQQPQFAHWYPAPGNDSDLAVEDLDNHSSLRRVVEQLRKNGATFIGNFMRALETGQESINPESASQHQGQAILMGKPLAIVKAELGLELAEPPAVHHGWHAFRQDLRHNQRETDNFVRVKFPVRVGEQQRLNDGVVGYWLENEGNLGERFYAPQSQINSDPKIITDAEEGSNTGNGQSLVITQSIDSHPLVLTLLVDPRGSIHITSGILPTKTITIPPDQYSVALKEIGVTFFTAPILSNANQIHLPLPTEEGFAWSWLQRNQAAWKEVSAQGQIQRKVTLDTFDNGEAIWDALLTAGWIKLIGSKPVADPLARASIVPKDQRTNASLTTELTAQTPAIELFLANAFIGTVKTNANFSGPQTIYEGWLRLRPLDET